jgi:dihydroneopterin aldolase
MIIRLNSIGIFAHHGAYDEEIRNGNHFEIDLEVEIPDTLGASTDELGDALDYTKLYNAVVVVSESRRYNLLEAFTAGICAKILDAFPVVINVGVKVRKIDPPMGGSVKNVEVELRMKRKDA